VLPERLGGSAGVNVLGTQCDFDRSLERKRERNCVGNEMRNLASSAFLTSLKQEVFEIVQFSFSIIRTMKTFKLLHVRYGKTSCLYFGLSSCYGPYNNTVRLEIDQW